MTTDIANNVPTLVLVLALVASALGAGVSPAAADHTTTDASLGSDGARLWMGQTAVYEDTSLDSKTIVEIYEVTADGEEFRRQLEVQSDAAHSSDYVRIDTAELGAGSYTIDGELAFSISDQTLDVDAAESIVTTDQGDESATEITVESNRVNFRMNVSADALEAAELYHLFDDATAYDAENNKLTGSFAESEIAYVQVDSGTLNVNADRVADLEPGDYTLTFAVVDSGAKDTTELTVRNPGEGNAQFGQSRYVVSEGDVTTLNVTLEDRETATLHFGTEGDNGYQASVDLDASKVDGNTVPIAFNSFVAGDGDDTTDAFTGTGVVAIREESDLPTDDDGDHIPLNPHEYGLALELDGTATTDLAKLQVTEHSKPTAETHLARGSVESAEYDQLDLYAGSEVARGDTAVVVFNDFGFDGMMQDGVAAEDLDSDSGSTLVDEYGISMTIVETNSGLNQAAKTIDVSNALVTKDAATDRLVLAIPLEGDALGTELEAGETYAATLQIDAESNPYLDASVDDGYAVSSRFTVADRTAEFAHAQNEAGQLLFQKSLNGTITVEGRSSVAPGTEYTVALHEDADLRENTTTVTADGTFRATFNVSDRAEGWEFGVEISGDEHGVGVTDAVIATVEQPDPEMHALNVTVENATGESLPEANVTVNGESNWDEFANGSTVTIEATHEQYKSVSDTILVTENTSHTITLDEPRDTTPNTSNEAEPTLNVRVETADGERLPNATVTVNGESEWDTFEIGTTVTVTANAEGYAETSEEVTIMGHTDHVITLEQKDESPASPEDPNQKEGPGFGIAVALIAVIATALLVRRRQS